MNQNCIEAVRVRRYLTPVVRVQLQMLVKKVLYLAVLC